MDTYCILIQVLTSDVDYFLWNKTPFLQTTCNIPRILHFSINSKVWVFNLTIPIQILCSLFHTLFRYFVLPLPCYSFSAIIPVLLFLMFTVTLPITVFFVYQIFSLV